MTVALFPRQAAAVLCDMWAARAGVVPRESGKLLVRCRSAARLATTRLTRGSMLCYGAANDRVQTKNAIMQVGVLEAQRTNTHAIKLSRRASVYFIVDCTFHNVFLFLAGTLS